MTAAQPDPVPHDQHDTLLAEIDRIVADRYGPDWWVQPAGGAAAGAALYRELARPVDYTLPFDQSWRPSSQDVQRAIAAVRTAHRAPPAVARRPVQRPGPRPGPSPVMDPTQLGWRLGRSLTPRGVELWVRYDRTTGVYGAQGSGKTLDLLAPALLAHPGAAMATLTKLDDLLLTLADRQAPLAGAAGGPALRAGRWRCSTRSGWPRACRSWCGTRSPGASTRCSPSAAPRPSRPAPSPARSPAAATTAPPGSTPPRPPRSCKGFFHAAALTGRTLEHVLEWVANPVAAEQPAEILRQHPHAARFWDGLLTGALHGSADTVGNTVTTVQQAMSLFFQPAIRARCVPGPGRPATDLRRPARPARDRVPARPGGPVRLRQPADDGGRRARPGHRAGDRQRQPARPASPRASWPAWTSCRPRRRCRPCGSGWPTSGRSGCRSCTRRRPGGRWSSATARTRPAACSA